jgi:hypothetical protein
LDAILAGAHPGCAAEDWVVEFQAKRHVAVDAINQRAGDTAAMCDLREYVAPDSGIFTAAVVEHDDAAGWYVVDEIAYRSSRLTGWSIKNRERSSSHAKLSIYWSDAMALPRKPESIQRIAKRSGVV